MGYRLSWVYAREKRALMEQKQQLISLLTSNQFTMSELCLRFGISRKTGHKWRDRYVEGGMVGLDDRSRAPKTVTCRTGEAVEKLIVLERRLHPTWGAKKIQRVLSAKHGRRSFSATWNDEGEAQAWQAIYGGAWDIDNS